MPVQMTPEYTNLLSLLDRPIAFHRVFVTITGSVLAGLMLSQAVYWHPRGSTDDNWFYKTRDEWKAETGLSRTEQETARKKLLQVKTVDGTPIWEEDLRGLPAKMYYRVNVAALFDLILVSGDAANKLAEILPTGKRETNHQAGDNPADRLEVNPPPFYTETTTDISAKNGRRPPRAQNTQKKNYRPDEYSDIILG